MSEATTEAAATEATEATESPAPKPTETVEFWKQKAREQEKRAKENAEAAKRLAEIEESQKSEAQRLADEASKWQGEAETWRSKSVASTVRALAATDFVNANDAIVNLDLSTYLDAGGEIDEAAIKADLAKLLEQNPHYRRGSDDSSRTPRPNTAQGTSGTPATADPAQQFASILSSRLSGA